MNNRYLLEHIRKLENELEEIKQKEEKLKKISLKLKKMCQAILDINLVDNDKKIKINKYLNSLIANLEIENKECFFDDKYLNKRIFFNIINTLNLDEYLFFIFKLKDSKEVDFASSFIESKFTPFLFVDIDRIVGVIHKRVLEEFENIKFIPYFNNGVYEELKFFVMFFELDKFDELVYERATNLFNRFCLKPSMSDKSYVHYSLITDKIIDFELIEKEKIKKEFSYINELTYPEVENLIRKEIKDIRFVLALLDRIDNELDSIRESQGRSIVVKRILSFIHRNQLDPQIQEMTKLLSLEFEKH